MPALLLFAACLAAFAEEPQAKEDESGVERERRAAVALLAPAKARQVDVTVGEPRIKAAPHGEPLLRWSNSTAGSVYGEVFLWTSRGRPVAIASIYRWYHPLKDSTIEFVSVAASPVQAHEASDLLWESKSSGVKFQPLPQAPRPAETAGARLSQMRAAARRFSAELADKRDGDEVPRRLRLLNQPVYRYASAEEHMFDGALFALVEVTDPEVWLLLEAVETGGRTTWQFALARMNADAIEVRLDDKLVQQWPQIVDPWKYRQAPYTLLGFNPERVKIEKPAEKR